MSALIGALAFIFATFGGGGMSATEQHVAAATMIAVHEQGGNMDDVETLLVIGWCESGYDRHAVNPESGAAGVWQHLGNNTWGWPHRMRAIGLPEDTPRSDILASARASAWLLIADEPGHGIQNWAASYDGSTCLNARQWDRPAWMTAMSGR